MPIIIDIGDALTAFCEDVKRSYGHKETQTIIDDVVKQTVCESIEALADLEESDLEYHHDADSIPISLDHELPEDRLTVELSEAVFNGMLNHVAEGPSLTDAHPRDRFRLVRNRYLIIETL